MDSNHYYLVDVFTRRLFGGNPLAVFPWASDFTTEEMQQIANELNLSETTFVQPATRPDSDCTVRIFTPRRELPMAGHPTLGTAHVLKNQGLLAPKAPSHFIFDEGIGAVQVDFPDPAPDSQRFSMHQPAPQFGEVLDSEAVASWLCLPPSALCRDLPVQIISCGVPYIVVPVRTLDEIQRADLNLAAARPHLQSNDSQEFLLYTRETEGEGLDAHCRMFAPRFGVPEDAATGSAQGPLASYLVRYQQIEQTAIRCEQGVELGRPSELAATVEVRGDEITGVRVSGECVSVGEGKLYRRS